MIDSTVIVLKYFSFQFYDAYSFNFGGFLWFQVIFGFNGEMGIDYKQSVCFVRLLNLKS